MRARTVVVTAAVGAVVAVAALVALTRSGERSGVGVVEASAETAPVRHGGDAADDPAIWVDPDDPRRSTVIGTDKQGALAVYDLAGREVQVIAGGNPNNVDLRDGFALGGRTVTLVAAGDRSDDTIAVYAVDERTRRLRDVAAGPLRLGIEVYGSCMYRSAASGRVSFIGTSEEGEVEQWELLDDGGRVTARRVRSFRLDTQTEGCVVDDEHGALYLAEEAVGVWRYGAEPSDGARRTRVAVARRDLPLVPDVEGLAIAAGPDGGGFLLASSQGDDSFAVFERKGTNAYVGSFRVEGVESTDGLEVTTTPLGAAFPQGVLVVQDGDNGDEHQNFKLVPWGDVAELLGRA